MRDLDFVFNFRYFNYRIVDPLINTGHFHAIIGASGVKDYFEFMNALNVQSAQDMERMLRAGREAQRTMNFFDWLIDDAIPRWENILEQIATKAR